MQVKLIGKKEFVAVALDPRHEIIVVYIASFESLSNNKKGNVYLSCRTKIAALIANESSTSIPIKYSNSTNIFFPKLASELLKNSGINNYAIELIDDWQLPYSPIYSQRPVELETLKTYIETNLANSFIRLSKSQAEEPIFFDKIPDKSFQLCVDYQGLVNFIIKNWYPLFLVREFLDQSGQTWWFIWLDLINAYYRMKICKKDE